MAHAKYLEYEKYKEYGGTLPVADFTMLEFKARKRIDYLTDSRIQNMESIPEAVELCMFSIMSVIGKAGVEAQITTPTVTSFSTDGYSESYGKALGAEDANKAVDDLIKSGLYGELDDEGTPLLYRGVKRPEGGVLYNENVRGNHYRI